jgi:predicted aminopeptidase
MDVLRFIVVPFSAALFLSGCQITYLLKSAYNQMNILYHREPIVSILTDSPLSTEERATLELTLKVRTYAAQKLNLNVGKNYSTYVQLNKKYVVWALNASPQWKMEHYLWHFPIVGAVPYKGFPDEIDATDEAKELQRQGYDTYIRGVSAYSTLGWFSDPLLSSMIRYSEVDLVNTIIHESVHATLYIKGNADFNERLASFIGDKGTELYYISQEGLESPHLQVIRDESHDQKIFSDFISVEIKNLSAFYTTNPKQDLTLRDKKFEEIKSRFIMEIVPLLKTSNHAHFGKLSLNNARLLLFKTYIEDLSDFQKLYDSVNGDLPLFLEKVKSLETHSNPVEGLKKLY